MEKIPDSSELSVQRLSLNWTEDGDLIMVHGGSPSEEISPFVQLWYVMPTHIDIIYPKMRLDLHSVDLPLLPYASNPETTYHMAWVTQWDKFNYTLGVTISKAQTATVLFNLDLEKGTLTKIQDLPQDTQEVLWSPDGSGALVLGIRSQLFFVSTHKSELLDLRLILGMDADNFTWLPPKPRE
jgi:hypothetical protein